MLLCALAAATFGALATVRPDAELVFVAIGFSVATLFFVGWTGWAIRTRKRRQRTYRVEDGNVHCFDGAGLLWREPGHRYDRIRWHDKVVPRYGRYGGYRAIQTLTLDHPREDRSFEIYSDRTRAIALPIAECCKLWMDALSLPVLRPEADQGLIRTGDELDMPLVDLVSEKRPGDGFDFNSPPPAGVRHGRDGDVLWVVLRVSPFYSLMGLLLALVFAAETFEAGSYLGMDAVTVTVVVVAVAVVLLPFGVREVVRVSPEDALGEYRLMGMPVYRRRLPLNTIVRTTRNSIGVVMEGQHGSIPMLFLGTRAIAWLAGFLHAAIVDRRPPPTC